MHRLIVYRPAAVVADDAAGPAHQPQLYRPSLRRPPRGRRSATHPIGRPSNSAVPVPTEEWLPVASIPALIGAELFEQAQAKLA